MNFSKAIALFICLVTCWLPQNAFGQNPQSVTPANIGSSAQNISNYFGGLIAVPTSHIETYYSHHFNSDPYDPTCKTKELRIENMDNDVIELEWSGGTGPSSEYLVTSLNLITGQHTSTYTQDEFITIDLDNDLYLVSVQSICEGAGPDDIFRSSVYSIIVDKPVMLNTSEGCYCKERRLVYYEDYESQDDSIDASYTWDPVQDIERYTVFISIDGHNISFPFDVNFQEGSNIPEYVAVDGSCLENVAINYSESSIYIPDPFQNEIAKAAMTFGEDNIFQSTDEIGTAKFRFSISAPYFGEGAVRITRCLDENLFINHYHDDSSLETLTLTNNISAHPNPTNNKTTIQYTTAIDDHITLALYNNYGQKIKTLVDKQWTLTGLHQIEIDLSNYPSGMYNCILESGKKTKHTRILRLE